MNYQTTKLTEKENEKIYLDNQEVSVSQFNEALNRLKPNQRILETSKHNFHIVERLQG
jgi:hypothetical protein